MKSARADDKTRRWCPEPALDQVRCSISSWVGDGGADPLEASHPLPAVGAHQPFHRALGHDDALPVQVGPHLHRPIQRLGPLAALRVGLVVAGQDLGDHHVPQSSRRQRSFDPGIERSRGDPAAVLRQHATDRSDPEPSPVLGDERTDQRCRGSLSRTKKDVAAFRISTVCSSSAFLRFSSRISRAAAVVVPSA